MPADIARLWRRRWSPVSGIYGGTCLKCIELARYPSPTSIEEPRNASSPMTLALDADITVRPAESVDTAAIARLCGQLGYPSTVEDVDRRLGGARRDADSAVFVADSMRGGVVGWVHARALHLLTRDACAEIAGLVVEEGRRGRGIGGRLMAAAEEWARQQGFSTLRLRSNVVRDEAHAFYRERGYASSKTSLLFTKTL